MDMEFELTENFSKETLSRLLEICRENGYSLSEEEIAEKCEIYSEFPDLSEKERLEQLSFLKENGSIYTKNDMLIFEALKDVCQNPKDTFSFLSVQPLARETARQIIDAFSSFFGIDIDSGLWEERNFSQYLMSHELTYSQGTLYRIFIFCICFDKRLLSLLPESPSPRVLNEIYYFFNHYLFSAVSYSIRDYLSAVSKKQQKLFEYLENS